MVSGKCAEHGVRTSAETTLSVKDELTTIGMAGFIPNLAGAALIPGLVNDMYGGAVVMAGAGVCVSVFQSWVSKHKTDIPLIWSLPLQGARDVRAARILGHGKGSPRRRFGLGNLAVWRGFAARVGHRDRID